MKNISFICIGILICLGVCGCATSRQPNGPGGSGLVITPPEVYERWNPENALAEAESDIRHDTIKIFFHGGIAAFPAGVDREDYELIEGLPFEDAGIGCVVMDAKLRRIQSEFATIYNGRIVKWLKQREALLKEGIATAVNEIE